MSSDTKNFYQDWPKRMSKAKLLAPDAAKNFAALFQAVMGQGELSVRDKELVALGIGMALRCDPCVYAHTEKALKAGATPAQIAETAGVVVMMQGGPAYTYLPKIAEALEALTTD
jgi:AhpD family alkylhydroperoxidase